MAQSYMGKVEPYEQFTIFSQTSGKVVKLDKNDETKLVSKTLIKLDSSLENERLKIYKKQLGLYNEKLKILEENYNKYKKITGKSKVEIDEKYYEIIDLKLNINNLALNIADLEDTISKKSIDVKKLYIKEFKVDLGDYVSTGSELATAYDISKSKVLVYVSRDDYDNIKQKTVLVNGKKGLGIVEKIDIVPDETYVSAYKVTVILKEQSFGEVVTVEFVN